MPRRPPFVYRPPTPEFIARQRLRYSWPEALQQAYRHDTVGLCRYLRSDIELDAAQRGELATLLERFVQQYSHRPPGRDVTPVSESQSRLLSLARSYLRRMQQDNDGRVPSGGIQAAVEQAAANLAEDGCWTFDIEQAVQTIRRRGVSPPRR